MQEVDREKVTEEVVALLDQLSFKKAKDISCQVSQIHRSWFRSCNYCLS
ncbi:MAG: hypothetical protein ACTSP7_11515 [Candidatus Heimdallarchaeota archaeon]